METRENSQSRAGKSAEIATIPRTAPMNPRAIASRVPPAGKPRAASGGRRG